MTNDITTESITTFDTLYHGAWVGTTKTEGGDCSPYHYASILSGLVGRTIRPQMMYNYSSKGYLKTVTTSTMKQGVTFLDGLEFAKKFVAKNGLIPEIVSLATV